MRILIMRFGPPVMIPQISEALKPHFANNVNAKAIPTSAGVISIFNTNSTPEQIADSLKELSDQLPFMVMPVDKARMQLPGLIDEDEDVTNVAETPNRPTLTVDEILDKVNASGMDSLTEVEKAILEGRA